MTHTITIEGLNEAEFERISKLLRSNIISPSEEHLSSAANFYCSELLSNNATPEQIFKAGAKWRETGALRK